MEELKLPDELEGDRAAIIDALGCDLPGNWPEGEKLIEATQPEAVARAIIPHLHSHLMNARMAFVFKKHMAKGDMVILGKAKKASAQLRFLAEVDFVVSFNWEEWPRLSHTQRVALVDHELSHCGYNLDDDKFVTVHHDVEEFGGIVQRWGLWKGDLRRFGRVCASQLDFFDRPGVDISVNGESLKDIAEREASEAERALSIV